MIFLWEIGFIFQKITSMKYLIFVKDRVVIYFIWLGSENSLQLMGDMFAVAKGIILTIVKKFCNIERVHLWKLFVQFPKVNLNLGFCQKSLKLYMEFSTSLGHTQPHFSTLVMHWHPAKSKVFWRPHLTLLQLYILHIPYLLAHLKNSTSIFPKIIIKVFTSNLSTSHHCLFLQQILF